MNFFNKFDKLKVKYKDNPGVKISFLLGVISILFIFVGGSYAFIFKSTYTQSINTISAGSLVITLENTTPVISISNGVPTPDDIGIKEENSYNFTLKNTGSINAKYKISLINSCTVGNSYAVGDSSVSADVCVPTKYVKAGISINDNDYKVVSADSNGNIILDESVLGSLRTSSYKLKLWLDYDTPNDYNVKDKNVIMSYRIKLDSEQTTEGNLDASGANEPTLTSNMIPVYYDSISNVWKKADASNGKKQYQWYDYVKKMWANAVTVTSTNRDTYLKASAGTTISMDDINTMWVWIPRYTYTMLNTCASIKNPTESANPKCYDYVYKDEYHDDLVNELVNDWVSDKTEAEEVITAWKNGEISGNIGLTFREYANPVNGNTSLSFDKSFVGTNVGEQSFDIKFESGTNSSGTIKCTDAVTGTSTTSETCTDTTNNGLVAGTSTYTHPAFWWDKNDNNVREENEELTGIWVGKFEVSSDTICTASFSVAVGSGCNLQTIRPNIKPNVTSWRGAQVGTFFNGIQKMRESGNKYGFSTTDETHMMKNMEWGAVTYLSHSKYGINKEVAINSASTYTTGCGPQSEGSTSSGATCNTYTTTLGQSASTTGNVYGVYDMSGGAYEYMMGNMVYSNGQQMSGSSATNNNYNSAFTGILYDSNKGTSFTGTYAFPSKRYYDKYSYAASSNTTYTRGKLGDATKEMAPTGGTGNWYGDYASFPFSSRPWFLRGGGYSVGAHAGAFGFSYSDGVAYANYSARAVLPGALD